MRDLPQSIPLPRSPQPVSRIQVEISSTALDLITIKRRLGSLADLIHQEPGALLPVEVFGGINAVRSDLLADAISTLNVLAQMSEGDVLKRHVELADLTGRIRSDV